MSSDLLPSLEAGDGSTIKIDPDELPLIIGRANDCQVTVNDHSISRRHAQITEINGRYFLEDLGSRNGTILNNARIFERTRIRNGDYFQVCDTRFIFKHDVEDTNDSSIRSILIDDPSTGVSSILSQLEVRSGTQVSAIDSDQKLEKLMHITRTLNRSLRLDETLQNVMDYLFQIFANADRGVIVLVNQNGEPEPLATKVRTSIDSQIRVSTSILEYVMGKKQSVLSHDLLTDDRIDTENSLANVPIRSVMSVPLIDSEENAIGMIHLDTTHRQQAFTAKDLELLTNVSIQSGMAIENSRLVEQLLESKLVTKELETARGVQKSLLPKEVPDIPGYSFHHFYRPMIQIGGDYFDYLRLDEDHVAIIVGDVVGHGIPAALLMAKLSSECRMALQGRESMATIAHRLNESFALLPPEQYATLILTVLDHRNHRLEVMNAGHLPPIRRHATGKVEDSCPIGNFAIGLYADAEIKGGIVYKAFELDVEPGDTVLLHTDGLNEALNEEREQYTRKRIHEQLVADECSDPKSAIDRLISDVGQHSKDASQHDDICLVGFRRDS